jgi:hypothetical protein
LFSGVKDQVDAYVSNLQKLCSILLAESNVSCLVTVYRMLDDMEAIKEALEKLREFP